MKRTSVILSILLLVIAGTAFLVPVFLRGEGGGGFDPYGDDWDDTSEMRGILGAKTRTIISTPMFLADIEDPEAVLLIIAGMTMEYSEPEVEAVIDFVDAGGKIMIACDNDVPNSLSDHFGIRYFDHDLLDPSFQESDFGNFSMLRLNATINGQNYTAVLNSPVGIEADEGEILCQSSVSSCIDLNDNRLRDLEDKGGPIPVMVSSERNSNGGMAVFISSSSVITNQGLGHPENRELVRGLISFMFAGNDDPQEVVFDISRRSVEREEMLLSTASYQVRLISALPILTISILVIMAAASLFWWLANPRPKEYVQEDSLSGIDPKAVGGRDIMLISRQLLLERICSSHRLMEAEGKLISDDMRAEVLKWDRKKAYDVLKEDDLADLLVLNRKKINQDTIDRIIRWSEDEQ